MLLKIIQNEEKYLGTALEENPFVKNSQGSSILSRKSLEWVSQKTVLGLCIVEGITARSCSCGQFLKVPEQIFLNFY